VVSLSKCATRSDVFVNVPLPVTSLVVDRVGANAEVATNRDKDGLKEDNRELKWDNKADENSVRVLML
jgi:hypothetical protein